MDIYRLPGHQMAKSSGGTGEIPDVLIIGDSMFRHFTIAKTGQFPIAFRSDTRPAAGIYHTGFQRKKHVVDWLDTGYQDATSGLNRRRLDEARDDIAAKVRKRLTGQPDDTILAAIDAEKTELETRSVALRVGNVDLDVETAVCVTLDFKVAALFPFDPKKLAESFAVPTSIFVVRVRSWLETYKVQRFAAPHLAFSQEVATLGIPADDVLGCLTVTRVFTPSTGSVSVVVTASDVNPNAAGGTTVADLAAAYANPVTVGLPAPKDADSAVDTDIKVSNIKAAFAQLTGNADASKFLRDRNVIDAGSTPKELPDVKPAQAKSSLRDSL